MLQIEADTRFAPSVPSNVTGLKAQKKFAAKKLTVQSTHETNHALRAFSAIL